MTKKHPLAVVNLAFDFTRQLVSGETISTVAPLVVSPPGSLTVGTGLATGNVVNANASAGTQATIYVVACPVTTSQGRTLYLEQGIAVNDPGNYP